MPMWQCALSAWQCADRLRGNARTLHGSMRKKSVDEQASVRTLYWLGSKLLCLLTFVGANVHDNVSGHSTPSMKEVCC